jgi:hypothetical protein
MSKHAPQPRLCPDCEAVAHALAEAGPANDMVFKRCIHNAVIGLGSKVGKTLVSWQIEGPLTDQQADQLCARLLLAFEAAGMKVHDGFRH